MTICTYITYVLLKTVYVHVHLHLDPYNGMKTNKYASKRPLLYIGSLYKFRWLRHTLVDSDMDTPKEMCPWNDFYYVSLCKILGIGNT